MKIPKNIEYIIDKQLKNSIPHINLFEEDRYIYYVDDNYIINFYVDKKSNEVCFNYDILWKRMEKDLTEKKIKKILKYKLKQILNIDAIPFSSYVNFLNIYGNKLEPEITYNRKLKIEKIKNNLKN